MRFTCLLTHDYALNKMKQVLLTSDGPNSGPHSSAKLAGEEVLGCVPLFLCVVWVEHDFACH